MAKYRPKCKPRFKNPQVQGSEAPIFRWIILINLKPFSCSLAFLIAFGCPRFWADPQYYIAPCELAMEMTDGDTLSDA